MTLGRVFCFLILFGISAIAADAQTPVDPIVLVDMTKDATCPPPMCYDGTGPLVEPYSDLPFDFVYDGTSPLFTLDLDITDVPDSLIFQCQSDIFTQCGQGSSGTTTLFVLTGAGIPGPGQSGTCTALSPCVGKLVSGDGVTVSAIPLVGFTPEPASIILFGTGLLLCGGILRRRWA